MKRLAIGAVTMLMMLLGPGCSKTPGTEGNPKATAAEATRELGPQRKVAESREDITPEMRSAIELGIALYAQNSGGNVQPSADLASRLRKYSDATSNMNSKDITFQWGGGTSYTILPSGMIEITFKGSLNHDLRFSGGTVGTKDGEVFATDGTMVVIDQVSYVARNNLWFKK